MKPDIKTLKKELRSEMLERRKGLSNELKKPYDQWICAQLESIIEKNNFQIIHAYLPIAGEIDIHPLLKNLLIKGIKIISPKTLPKRKLENRVLTSLRDVEIGVMKTRHPAQPDIYTGQIDMIIVPGLAFDNKNYRLGFGGGYYDNFLAEHPEAFKIGIFYPFQQVDLVPIEPHDYQLSEIIHKDFD